MKISTKKYMFPMMLIPVDGIWMTFFTSIMLEYIEEAGEVNDSIMYPFRGYDLQLNAYSMADDFSSLDFFVSIYNAIVEISKFIQQKITNPHRGVNVG